MAYTPTNWSAGDTITAEKLNKMEGGIENANEPFIITFTPTAEDFSGTMDKTPQEILNAYKANRRIRAKILGVYSTDYIDLWAFMTSAVFYDHPTPEYSYVQVSFEFVILYGEVPLLVQATTQQVGNVYTTMVFPLTPMS